MSKLFYPKLAASNIRKNGKTYIPYLLTCIITVAMFYVIRSLSLNDGLKKLVGAETVAYTLYLGCWVVAIFAVIFLFYTNSFLVKRRKKEFGLFNILGMEKKHLSKVVALETLYVAVISLTVGIGLGIALDKAMYLLILKIINAKISLGFYLSPKAMLTTVVLFCAIYLLIFLNSLRQIHVANPIELLRGSDVGEKEPKTKWIMTILGVLCLAAGYYIAVITKDPVAAILLFFGAVILVIVGTYLLFTTGSIALLKLLRRKKRYYYQTKHFTSVSGMMYRMKQNAVGLANICILSTMVLVMISSTSAMMIGMEDMVNARYPYDITIYFSGELSENGENLETVQQETAEKVIQQELAEKRIAVTEQVSYPYLTFAAVREENTFLTDQDRNISDINKVNNLFFVPLSDYNRITNQEKTLNEGEILLYSDRETFDGSVFKIFDREYTVKEHLKGDFLKNGLLASNISSTYYIVVEDLDEVYTLEALQKEAYQDMASSMRLFYGFNMDEDESTQKALYNDLLPHFLEGKFVGTIDTKVGARESFLSLYGGLFFLGIFLGTLFIMATILIIYYKQISEGYDDKDRFMIMQKVGMSHAEVKQSIHSQILQVFFLPLILAGVHVAFSLPMVSRILTMLSLTNTTLLLLCTAGCFLIFALLYAVIYALTARTYYHIVSQ